jgi:hypothetical protein
MVVKKKREVNIYLTFLFLCSYCYLTISSPVVFSLAFLPVFLLVLLVLQVPSLQNQ